MQRVRYAFDTGGKKIIVVNSTSFSHEEIMTKLQTEESLTARLNQLFYSSKLSAPVAQADVAQDTTKNQTGSATSSQIPKI